MNAHSNDQPSNLISNSISSTEFNLSGVVAWLQNGWNGYVHLLVQGDRPRVWQKRNRFGMLQWYAHDPISGRSIQGVTENEALIWLESILYR